MDVYVKLAWRLSAAVPVRGDTAGEPADGGDAAQPHQEGNGRAQSEAQAATGRPRRHGRHHQEEGEGTHEVLLV